MIYPVRLSNTIEDILENGRDIIFIDVVVEVVVVIQIMYKLEDFQQINKLSAWKIQDSNGIAETTVTAGVTEVDDDDVDQVNISSLINYLLVKRYTKDSVKEIYPLIIVPLAVVSIEYDVIKDKTDLVNVINIISVDFPARKQRILLSVFEIIKSVNATIETVSAWNEIVLTV